MHLCWPSKRHVIAAVTVLALAGAAAASPALADCFKHSHHHKHHSSHSHSHQSNETSGDDGETSDDTTTDGNDDQSVSGAVPTTGAEQLVTFKITGFGKIDNTPRNSTTISFHCIHKEAGGTGTWSDPLTAATPGHVGSTENPKCTKFYVPGIHRYVIIEDSGATKFSQPHLDIWSGTTDNVEDCESKITKTEQIIRNPGPGHPVTAGPIATGSGCNI